MKHIFIINPTAGKGKAAKKIIPVINSYCKTHKLDAQLYVTKFSGDGMKYVEEIAKRGEPVRFYSCGGDGTLYEVVNGAYKYPNAEVACLPLGSGNDFARLFGKRENLTNLDSQVNGSVHKLDLIKCGDKVAVNQCSMGIDAEVCAKQAYFKKIPLITGEAAYTASLLYCLGKRLNSEFKVTVDDDRVIEGTMLFALCGNSRWYGGGYMGAPKAIPDDGLLDFIIVRKTVGRLKLAGLINAYKRGEHLDWDFTTFLRGKKMHIESTTLDTTVRKVIIENLPFLLSDTVGFIRKLPTDLVDSFKSTLDEVREADLLVHVVDISHPDFEEQIQVVDKTITDLGAGGKPTMIVFNKIDAYTYVEKAEDDLTPKTKENITLEELMKTWMAKMNDNCIFISARNRTNIEELRDLLYKKVRELHVQKYPYNDFLYQNYEEE